MRVDWRRASVDQLGFYWDATLGPRLQGLTDEEYYWEPAPGCWSVRPGPDGRLMVDGAGTQPEPDPPPVTTIAWRLAHITGSFHTRASTFFGDGTVPPETDMFDPRHEPVRIAETAEEALELLRRSYEWWRDGVLSLDETELTDPLGACGGWFADSSMAQLVLHLNRECMHHGGEVCLLRDLFRASPAR